MPSDPYHGRDGLTLGRRIMHLGSDERIAVSCERCGKAKVYGPETLIHFRQDCAVAWLGDILPPKCWTITERQPADCVRQVAWFNEAMEDVGCSEEG